MHVLVLAGLEAAVLLATPPARADVGGQPTGPDLEHQPIGCVIAGRFPTVEACARPRPGRALAHFRARGQFHWYYVQMKPKAGDDAGLEAVLPKPRPETEAIEYYLEAFSSELAAARTREFTADVAGSAAECGGKGGRCPPASARQASPRQPPPALRPARAFRAPRWGS